MDNPKKTTPLAAIAEAVKSATKTECATGEGYELGNFLGEKATSQKDGLRLFVTYSGFREGKRYMDGYENEGGSETYTLYIQAGGQKLRETVNAIRDYLRKPPNAEFIDTSGGYRFIAANSGAAMRENGYGVFEMTLTIN